MSRSPVQETENCTGDLLPDKILFFVYKWLLDMEISIL